MTHRPWWQRALQGAGVAGGIAGAAYAAERAVVAGVRRSPDPDSGRDLTPPFDEARRIPSHDGGSLYTISRGRGPTVVFSHGVTLNVRLWYRQFEALPERGLRVVAYDHRGHGESECGTAGHSVENLAEDLKTVIERLDLRDVVVVGHSMGGIAAQTFAIHQPTTARKRVRGLVLMSTFAKTHLSASPLVRSLAELVASRGPDSSQVMSQRNLGFFLARLGFGRDPQPSQVELTRRMMAECRREESQNAIRPLLGVDLTPDLPSIDLPTLVLSGSADLLAPPSESRRIADLIPDARLEVFKGAGHMLMFERTDEIDDLIVEFARDVRARGPRRRWWPRPRGGAAPRRPGRRARVA
ncbi:MAG TPA: alpha/beta hydrolase [Acidimicrobiia bacterium]